MECYWKTQEVIHLRGKLDGVRCRTHLRLRSSEIYLLFTGDHWYSMADPNPKTVAYGCTIFGICREMPGAVLTYLIRTASAFLPQSLISCDNDFRFLESPDCYASPLSVFCHNDEATQLTVTHTPLGPGGRLDGGPTNWSRFSPPYIFKKQVESGAFVPPSQEDASSN